MKIKPIVAIVAVAFILLSSCTEDAVKSIDINDFIGNYTLGDSSYSVPLDASGKPILTEMRSFSKELVSLSRGKGDTLILSSPTIGNIKSTPKVDGDKLRLNIPEQPYDGILNPAGEDLRIKPVDNFYFGKRTGGDKFFDAEPGKGRFEVRAMGGGKKYELQVRCCPRTS